MLTPIQLALANLLLNLQDKKPVKEKLKELSQEFGVEVTTQQYNVWLRQPAFADYLKQRAESMFKSSDFAAYNGLVKSVESGDLNGIKLFLR